MNTIKERLTNEIKYIKSKGLFKDERIIQSPQNSKIITNNNNVINFCANNYLGLSNNSELIKAAKKNLDKWGFGLSSVRFICGTQTIHKNLENKISNFLKMDDTILYSSCYDANGGLFETILNNEDAIISDSLNHASIIDGIRLCKAKRYRYTNNDMDELESILKITQNARTRLIATDGIFSMDGYVAKLNIICDLAEKYNSLVMVDDSHATGFFGTNGRGSIEYCSVIGRVDIITSTLGKALGGASGGFTSANQEIIDILRQKSRTYLFSNTLAPVITSTSIKAIEIIEKRDDLRKKLKNNTNYFRKKMEESGFNILPGIHPIVPIIIGDARLAQNIANDMLKIGIYVISFSYPVVPKNKARIRVQLSASHTKKELNTAINAFIKIGIKYKILK